MESLSEDDALWRTLFLVGLGTSLLLFLLGGLVGRLAGRWQLVDGAVWQLRQHGPWVHGVAQLADGRQLFNGVACFGWAWLSRRDYGVPHLRRLGFSDEQAQRVQGQVTGNFRLRRRGPYAWAGQFTGRSFSFADDGSISARLGEPQARRLERLP